LLCIIFTVAKEIIFQSTQQIIMEARILIIDNYDSFTWNLVDVIRNLDNVSFDVVKNDEIDSGTVNRYRKILISPGPGVPGEVKVLQKLIREFASQKSILGICLGHQAIAETFGASLYNLSRVYHGTIKKVTIIERADYLFSGLPAEIEAGLYHSWAVKKESLPPELKITAISNDGIVMGLSHAHFDVKGIQFHPESYMTGYGRRIIENWINN
jgi:anthranilate synthase component II